MIKNTLVLIGSLIFAISCQNQNSNMNNIEAPVAKKVSKELIKHDDVRVDNYYWMNNREDSTVIAHLENENKYYAEMTAHTKDFEASLFEEMKARIKEDDSSVPYKKDGYWYMTRYEKGKEYPIYSRKKGDTVSRRKYTLQIKNLETGVILEDKITNTAGGAVWADDNKTIFYTKKDDVTLRFDKIFKHRLGVNEDELVFNEKDETFGAYVYKSKSKKFIIIGSYSTLTTEFRTLRANNPDGNFKVFQARTRGLEYSISHYGNDFYVLTNKDGATNK